MSQSKIESQDMRQALQSVANSKGFIELPDFVQIALYHENLGYYAKKQNRVGRDNQSDFYTASSFKVAFAEIVIEAAVSQLEKSGKDPAETVWIEIGAEPNAALLTGVDHPFKEVDAIRVGQTIELSGELVVFSNELFDAQPFRQIRFENGEWTEFGVTCGQEQLEWRARTELSSEATAFLSKLPAESMEGYTIDLPTGASKLASRILSQSWTGIFIAFDYGKTWTGLIQDTPLGTARSYFKHQQLNDVLANPGEQDITHHICWDHIESALTAHGFGQSTLQSQEAFIAYQAPKFMQKVFDPNRSSLDPLRTKLKELMHPAFMGQKFQAMCASRPTA